MDPSGGESVSGADAARASKLLERATASLALIDAQASGAWSRMAPGEAPRAALKDAMGAYLEGGDEEAMDRAFRETEALVVSLLAGMSRVAPVAWGHVARLEPGRIEGLSKAEKKSWQSAEYACWSKYKELMGEMDASSFEDEMLEAIGRYVRQLIEKRRRAAEAAGAQSEEGAS